MAHSLLKGRGKGVGVSGMSKSDRREKKESEKKEGEGGEMNGVKSEREEEVKVVEEEEMIKFMSENPRFGNLQAEEKEYFSGSLVESRKENRVHSEVVVFKKSNSYNEER